MALSEHEASEFAYGANFLGIERTDELVQIQVFWAPGKRADTKKAMYRKIVENLGRSPGVRAEDIMISVFEASAENWSFGNGETQFFKGEVRYRQHSSRIIGALVSARSRRSILSRRSTRCWQS